MTRLQVFRKMRQLDIFGQRIPGFNVKGEERVKTNFGAFLTVVMYSTIFYYTLLKFIHLYTHHNPTISTYAVDTNFFKDNPINLHATKMKPAFRFYGYKSDGFELEMKNDPRYVRTLVFMNVHQDGEDYEEVPLDYHVCSEEEYAELFYEIEGDQRVSLQNTVES